MDWNALVSQKVGEIRTRKEADKATTYELYRVLDHATMAPRSGCGVTSEDGVNTFFLGDAELFQFLTEDGVIRVLPAAEEEKRFNDTRSALDGMADILARAYVSRKD